MSECVRKETYRGALVLSAAECRQIIERKLKAEGNEVMEVKTAPLSETPAGFLGEHYIVTITVSTNKNQTSEIKIFVKTVPTDPLHADFAISIGSYRKETNFFSVLLPDLLKYEGDLKEGDGHLDWSCECYLTTPEKIVLEDLSARGFRNQSLGVSCMDYDHCVVVLKALASFHASSLIFEEKETQRTGKVCRLNEVYPEQFTEILWVSEEEHSCYKLYAVGIECISAMLKYLPGWDGDEERHEDLVKRTWASHADVCTAMATPSKKIRNVMSHGDLWSNNILIRYDENDNGVTPVEVKFVDFQLLRYTTPAHDFLTFLHLNTRRQMRDQHLQDFAVAYHDTLRAELTRHHLDVDGILPWDQFQTSLAQYREMAVLTANLYCPFTNIDPEVIGAMSRSQEVWKKFMFEDRTGVTLRWFEANPAFKELLTERLEELVDILQLRQM